MKELYSQLYKDCACTTYKISGKDKEFKDFGHFVAMKGPEYENETVKLMIIGRATNGWDRIEHSSEEDFARQADIKFREKGFQWVVSAESNGELFNNEQTYRLSSSPFWRTSKSIWEQLSSKSSRRWVDHIAWSNLYKAAPCNDTKETRYDYGNPSTKLCRTQMDACRKILMRELEEFEPTHILFITGWDWFYDWLTTWGKSPESSIFGKVEKEPPIGKNHYGNGIYAEGTLTITLNGRKVPVVVACRPEHRPEQDYAADVLAHFPKP